MRQYLNFKKEARVPIHIRLSWSEAELVVFGKERFNYESINQFMNEVLKDAVACGRVIPETYTGTAASEEPRDLEITVRIPISAYIYITDVLPAVYTTSSASNIPRYLRETLIDTMVQATAPTRGRLKND